MLQLSCGLLVLSSQEKSFSRSSSLSNDLYDRSIARTELLTYTMEGLDVSFPLREVTVSWAKKAPTREIEID